MWTELFLFTHRSESERGLYSALKFRSECSEGKCTKTEGRSRDPLAHEHLRAAWGSTLQQTSEDRLIYSFTPSKDTEKHQWASQTHTHTQASRVHSSVSHLSTDNKCMFISVFVPLCCGQRCCMLGKAHKSRHWPCVVQITEYKEITTMNTSALIII